MQEMHWSGSTQAIWPPDGHPLAGKDRRGPARHRSGLGDRLADELRRVGRSAEEQALAGEVHRAELHVRFEEEPVGVQRHAQQFGQLAAIGPRHRRGGQHDQVRLQHQVAAQRRLPRLEAQFPAGRRATAACCVRLVTDEEHALLPRLAVGRLAETVGPHVAVEDHDPGVRPAVLQFQGVLHGRRAADAAAIRPFCVALLDALDHRHGGLLRERNPALPQPIGEFQLRHHPLVLAIAGTWRASAPWRRWPRRPRHDGFRRC